MKSPINRPSIVSSLIFYLLTLFAPLVSSPKELPSKRIEKAKKISLPCKAVVVIPVADTTQTSVRACLPQKATSVQSVYNQFPSSPEIGELSCLRARQLLFNQQVTVTKITDEECEITIPDHFYLMKHDLFTQQHSTYWTLKKNLYFLHELEAQKILLSHFPEPIDYQKEIATYRNGSTIVLTQPWNDPTTSITYSAGTRFKRDQSIDNQNYYGAQIFNPITLSVDSHQVPTLMALVEQAETEAQARKKFLELLTMWACKQVPFVWGGKSFSHTLDHNAHAQLLIHQSSDGTITAAWQWNNALVPQTGVDNSGLILLAAQICGLHAKGKIYPYENTQTALHALRPIKKGEAINDGDFIWSSGSLQVITSLERHEMITALGFNSGYKSVALLPLQKFFEHVKTYADLRRHYDGCDVLGKPLDDGSVDLGSLALLSQEGSAYRTIEGVLFLTFA